MLYSDYLKLLGPSPILLRRIFSGGPPNLEDGGSEMLEWLMVPALIGVAAFVPGTNNDKKKIKRIFEATGYGVPDKERKKLITPQFRKKLPIMDQGEEIGMRYLYSIPLGLPATKAAEMEKSVGFFTDGLNRPVIVEFRRVIDKDPRKYLTINVFNKEIPNLYPYASVPKQNPIRNEETKKEFMEWLIPLGRTLENTIWHDFDKTPHMTVAGTTRFGKTVFLKVLMTYLIEHHPDNVELYIIDLKGGLEFGRYKNLKQVKGVASNSFEAYNMLMAIHQQLQDEYEIFRKNYWTNVSNTPIRKRKFVIVDEAAQLAPEKWMDSKEKDMLGACQWVLGEITRIGGGLGWREIFCTQYPTADTLPRSIKQNSDGKITFRLPSGYASDVAIDEHGAEKLPSDVKGRGLYKTHELKEMQAPFISDEEMWERLSPHLTRGDIPDVFDESREEEETPRRNLVEFISDEVRNKTTPSKNAQSRNRQKRNRSTKKNEGIPPHSEPRGKERLLPKRQGKGVGRGNRGNQVDPPS